MSNIIKKGIDWLNDRVDTSCVEPVYVITADVSRSVMATVIEPESRINNEGIRIQSDTFTFLFNSDDLKGLTIQRGIKFRRVDYNKLYEAVLDNRTFDDYNDPNLTKRAIPAKLCS